MEKHWKSPLTFVLYAIILSLIGNLIWDYCNGICTIPAGSGLILHLGTYQDEHLTTAWEQLIHRIQVQPFNLVATIIFACAICHTFVSHYFSVLSKKLRDKNRRLGIEPAETFSVEILRFMGEVEVIFGIWVIPLFLSMAYVFDWPTAVHYMDELHYTEPVFVVVIMSLASTRPILKLAEDSLRFVARLGNDSATSWWWAILTIGPLSGSLITEPGAMTISALLLGKKFYELHPSPKFAYATLGLLFTNISVGGVFTNFAAPPVLMVAKSWNWSTPFMMQHFGWKAVLGILIANSVYFFIFRHEFSILEKRRQEHLEEEKLQKEKRVEMPYWITFTHVLFLAWTVAHNHYPVIFVGCFLLFLGFYQATVTYQNVLNLKPAVLVGFFLGGLVVHGNLQGWWIEPLLGKASEGVLLVLSTVLTSFNDNAAITFLATLIPTFSDSLKYAVVAGAVTGGGLTVIANAPNPSGQAILSKYFYQGVSAVSLLSAAIFPASVMGIVFYLLRAF